MELALVRHGQTDWNLQDRLQGSSDVPLNETGRAQAIEAAALLSAGGWDAVISSPLGRAVETATIIASILAVPIAEPDPELVERDYGSAEGLTKEEAIARFGTTWPGQESYEDLEARALAAIDTLAAAYADERLVVVTHGTFIRAFVDAITGLTTVKPPNGESVHVSGVPGEWHVTAGLRV